MAKVLQRSAPSATRMSPVSAAVPTTANAPTKAPAGNSGAFSIRLSSQMQSRAKPASAASVTGCRRRFSAERRFSFSIEKTTPAVEEALTRSRQGFVTRATPATTSSPPHKNAPAPTTHERRHGLSPPSHARSAGNSAAAASAGSVSTVALTPMVVSPPCGMSSACSATPTRIASGARRPSTTPTSPLSSRWTLVGPSRTWIDEATKNAAVKSAMRGTSSSRTRQEANSASAAATANPSASHGQSRTPSAMWMAQMVVMAKTCSSRSCACSSCHHTNSEIVIPPGTRPNPAPGGRVLPV